ncbi:TRAP transporter large permease [Shumkonia mesophila]|uniref:TRAP transporter large permease n=1 Tax=Shumkonia mesophila TaxID=2838854 RepID=UPI00293526A1|nr:TRAP transporter large permease [Shumkonia mesophila]
MTSTTGASDMVIILFASFFALLLLGIPIVISLGIASLASIYIGSDIPFLILPQKIFNGMNNFAFMAIPLFLLAGNIMAEAKISDKLVGLAAVLVGRFPGGLAHMATGASAFFGAISGSAPATTAAIGSVLIPPMVKRGYSPSYSAAVVASSGALGLIIPPSLTMVIFGVMAGTSIGKMFLCGVIPGILIAVALMVMNYVIARRRNFACEPPISARDAWIVVKDSLIALVMPLIILGGIYSGAFTATESAAVACLYGLIVGFAVYRNLTVRSLVAILKTTAENAAVVMFLMGTANLFGFIITAEQVPQNFANFVLGITDNQYVVMLLVLAMLLVVGTFLDNVAALVLLVPTMMGIVNALNLDPIYFGVFTIIALAVGQITPPVGLNLFIAANIAKQPVEPVAAQALPYIAVYIVMLLIFILFPGLLMLFN